jgi:prepilin-type N-terminal cleavage/methylation domain-containing protein
MTNHRSISRQRAPQRAFTLIEILISISVIVILVAIVSVVGSGALSGQKAAQTRGLLYSLDRALEEYELAAGSFPRYRTAEYLQRPGPAWANPDLSGAGPDTDNTSVTGKAYATAPDINTGVNIQHHRKPSAGVFIAQARGVTEADAIITSLPSTLLAITPRRNPLPAGQSEDLNAVTVLDGWSKPIEQWQSAKNGTTPVYPALQQSYIVYVHPENTVAQALYGTCKGGRPYFMSAGPDGLVGLRDETDPLFPGEDATKYKDRIHKALQDNVYSYPVGAPDTSDQTFNDYRIK